MTLYRFRLFFWGFVLVFQPFQVISINFHQNFYENWKRFGFKWISLLIEEIGSKSLLFQETELEQISWTIFRV